MDNVLTLMNQVPLHFLIHIAYYTSIVDLKYFIGFSLLAAELVELESFEH